MQKKVIIGFVSAICLFASFFIIGYYNFYVGKLKDFRVTSIKGSKVYFEGNKFATKYNVIVSDENDEILYETTTLDNNVDLANLNASYGKNLNIKVVAFNKKAETKESINNLAITWEEPSFDEQNSYYAKPGEAYQLMIKGNYEQGRYSLVIKNQDNIIFEEKIVSNKMAIDYNLIKNYSGKLTALIVKDDNTAVAKRNFYVNTTLVGFVKIISPQTDSVVNGENIIVKYEGGAQANHFYLAIYQDDVLISEEEIDGKEVVIDSGLLQKNNYYTFEIKAVYNDYAEISQSDSITVKVEQKKQVEKIYTDVNYQNVKNGYKISLLTNTERATIYYTTDGSNPTIDSAIYTSPIAIEENTVIKAIGYKETYIASEISTFNINVNNKDTIVYLSPSNQNENFGVSSVGYTNEMEMMNKVADVVENKLKKAGIKVYRNSPDGNIKSWTKESRDVKADLHLALHSNGSHSHELRGMEIFVDNNQSPAYSLANSIYKNLYSIYPGKSAIANRGVRYAEGSLGEVNPLNVKFAILFEIAFHDQKDDAKWIVDNIETIGNNIANSVIYYYLID